MNKKTRILATLAFATLLPFLLIYLLHLSQGSLSGGSEPFEFYLLHSLQEFLFGNNNYQNWFDVLLIECLSIISILTLPIRWRTRVVLALAFIPIILAVSVAWSLFLKSWI
jgi:hypothetical protein